MLNFNHLFYFKTIAEEGSIVKASKKLHLTQPTLSGQLRQLEEYLGKKLFDRRVRKLVLNENGKMVMDYARKIFGLGDEMVRNVREESGTKVRVVKIGILPSLSKFLINRMLIPFMDEKSLVISVREGSASSLLRELEVGELNFVLSDEPAPAYGGRFENHNLHHRNFVVVGSRKYKTAKEKFPKSLQGLPFATFTQYTHVRSEIDEYLQSRSVFPNVVGEFDDIVLLEMMALKGKCITILPKHAVQESIESGKLFELGTIKNLHSDLWVVFQKSGSENQRYLQLLRAHV